MFLGDVTPPPQLAAKVTKKKTAQNALSVSDLESLAKIRPQQTKILSTELETILIGVSALSAVLGIISSLITLTSDKK